MVGLTTFLQPQPAAALLTTFDELQLSVAPTTLEGVNRLRSRDFDLTLVGMPRLDGPQLDEIWRIVTSTRIGGVMLLTSEATPVALRLLLLHPRLSLFHVEEETYPGFAVALKSLAEKKRYISAGVAQLLRDPHWRNVRAQLTGLEEQVLSVIGTGGNDKDAAIRLDMRPMTVRWHRRQIMERFELHNRRDLQRFAIRFGYTLCAPDGHLHPLPLGRESRTPAQEDATR